MATATAVSEDAVEAAVGRVVADIASFFFLEATGISLWVWSAWCVCHLWAWFITPFGAPSINVPHAMGIIALVAWPMRGVFAGLYRSDGKRKKTGETIAIQIAIAAAHAIVLLECWILHHFFM